jgi:hypothetical protein
VITAPMPLAVIIILRIFVGYKTDSAITQFATLWLVIGFAIQMGFGIAGLPRDNSYLPTIFFIISNIMLIVLSILKYMIYMFAPVLLKN